MTEIQVFQAPDGSWTWLLVDEAGVVLAGKVGLADVDTAKAAARRVVDGEHAHSPLRLMKLGEGQKRPARRGGATVVTAPAATAKAAKAERENVEGRRRSRSAAAKLARAATQ